MRTIRPISELGSRVPEAGKIRLGIKVPNRDPTKQDRPKAIDTFRFTSPYADVIDQLAALYGGTPAEWDDAKAKVRGQRQVITEAKTIDVLVPPGGLTQHYELWSGSGCVRRCNGLLCEVPSKAPDEDLESVPCLCTQNQNMECAPKTRMSLVLPNVTFRGIWLLESSSWNAAEELVGMEHLLQQMQAVTTITEAQLHLQQRSQMTRQGKQNFVVPVLTVPHTPNALAAGGGGLSIGQHTAGHLERARLALEAGVPVDVVKEVLDEDRAAMQAADAEETDAEVIPSAEDVATRAADLANTMILDPHGLLTGTCRGVSRRARGADIEPAHDPESLTEDELIAAASFLEDVAEGRVEIVSITDGNLTIKRSR